jgi:hypothetical protein
LLLPFSRVGVSLGREMSTPTPDHTAAIREALFAGNKIQAIKLYRDQTGLGLKESKDAVEEIDRQLRISSAHQFQKPGAAAGGAEANQIQKPGTSKAGVDLSNKPIESRGCASVIAAFALAGGLVCWLM